MKLYTAHAVAARICRKLKPHCRTIHIAGSIRRKAKQVNDIEIVCLPKMIAGPQKTLFDETDCYNQISPEFIAIVNSLGKPIKGKPSGKYMQIELPEAINLDLFMPDDYDYYRQLAIRTGSVDYSLKVLANAWRNKGWCGSDKGLRKIVDCVEVKSQDNVSSKWKCVNPTAVKPPAWVSEEHFFAWLGLQWIDPVHREIYLKR